LSISSCNESRALEEDPADDQLGATVQKILEEENVEGAIWNPEGMEQAQGVPAIQVENAEELRDLIKAFKSRAQEWNKTIDHINTVNHRRFESYSRQLSSATSRKDSLKVAMQFPDITYIRDTSELIELGLLPQH